MEYIKNQVLTGERALFFQKDAEIINCKFYDGESPLKESQNIQLNHCTFAWKYPIWYSKNIQLEDCNWEEMGRSGVWYTQHLVAKNCDIAAPKNFRYCKDITLIDCKMAKASETFWKCNGIKLENVEAVGDYFGMNSENIEVHNLHLDGNYCFDGGKNITVYDSYLNSKDSFWNCENVKVYNSTIIGEYLGWNTKNAYFENCTIESLQGMCYMDNLVMKNCRFKDTTLAFEYCNCDIEIIGSIDSIKNPSSGKIVADEIKELIMEDDRVDITKTTIILRK